MHSRDTNFVPSGRLIFAHLKIQDENIKTNYINKIVTVPLD